MNRLQHADPLLAASPEHNASVHASAGTGKTWLLVTRIVRLLLAGAGPDSILAVTFTRKAAAEMQQRVTERLRDLMQADAAGLDQLLQLCGVQPDPALRQRARQLYEETLFNPYALRATTFHAFCQELLQRFPLEAGIAPGFEICESTGLLEQAARDALVAETSAAPDSVVAAALDRLVEGCGGLGSTQAALRSFLAHRSDWWAYTQGQHDELQYARANLEQLLEVRLTEEPLAGFPDAAQRTRLQEFAALLGRNVTRTNTANADRLATSLADGLQGDALLTAIQHVFLTKDGAARACKASAAQRKRLGEQDELRYLALHAALCADLLAARDRLARRNTLQTSLAWYRAGVRLLEHYQRIKQEQRVLDFSDLEWKACELLNRSDHASWVQYKLDARIDHLLVDEFQDTNPTQWQLLLPLLEELAAGNDDRSRSVFLVGDRKQSIYSFRRANPALLGEAAAWLQEHLQAGRYPLDASRRSAGAIIDCVNAVFGSEPLRQRLADFNPHSTHLSDVYGRVELLPLMTADKPEIVTAAHLRNPLRTPRIIAEDQRHADEGRLIARTIEALLAAGTVVDKDAAPRLLDYGDIMILLRQRTHATAYEQALRDAGIPYLSASKGVLLDNLEVRDLEALLNLLIAPYDNLSLAQVLRSPLFGLTSEALLPLARQASGSWYERLATLAGDGQAPYTSACAMLQRWRELAGTIPVHDLLDSIFHEAEVLQRYEAAFPPAMQPRVRASLTRFIELALEVDNGRYPSLPRFLEQLERLRQSEQDQPDENAPEENGSRRVRLLTIHGAKGLEAPVVFLADAASGGNARNAHAALVDWPGDRDRPVHFLLAGRQAELDSKSRALLEKQEQDSLCEDANLLYVAITRARQYLYISGSEADRNRDGGWYSLVRTALEGWDRTADGNPFIETGTPQTLAATGTATRPAVAVDPRLSGPVTVMPALRQIAPSYTAGGGSPEDGDPDGRERGIAIHLMLEQLTGDPTADTDKLYRAVAGRLGRETGDSELQDWWQAALQTWRDPALAIIFDSSRYRQASNEVPLQYLDGGRLVYGVIDRLLVQDDSVLVIDYKTHQSASPDTLPALAANYREQLRLYARGAAALWPGRDIQSYLLFTACNQLVEMDG
jgi:ATP-dependent helicase/nuclease subunit A